MIKFDQNLFIAQKYNYLCLHLILIIDNPKQVGDNANQTIEKVDIKYHRIKFKARQRITGLRLKEVTVIECEQNANCKSIAEDFNGKVFVNQK